MRPLTLPSRSWLRLRPVMSNAGAPAPWLDMGSPDAGALLVEHGAGEDAHSRSQLMAARSAHVEGRVAVEAGR